jgi:hypothetical protein
MGVRYAQAQQQARITFRCGVGVHHACIAGGFPAQGVFGDGQVGKRMEEEEAPPKLGDPAEPEVGTTHVRELMAERHGQFVGREHARGRQQHHRTQGADSQAADHVRRVDRRSHA